MPEQSDKPDLWVRDLGSQEYRKVWDAMKAFTDHRGEDTPDELWLVEHGPKQSMFLGGSSSIAPGVSWENLQALAEGFHYYRKG